MQEKKIPSAKKIFSPEQERAINTRDRTLLVSAAAGSGKTTTLTERIIRSLLDEKNPESIRDMLIVTFTNASVYDLREKISEALLAASLEHPESVRLEEELRSLDYARIMTIDSFCAELVRSNAERLGITPLYRVCEGAESAILQRSMIDALIERTFEGDLMPDITPERFELLCDALTGVKNTASLADVLLSLFEKTKSMVRGVDVFFDFAKNYLQYSEKKPEDTPYVAYIINETKETLRHFPRLLSSYTEPLLKSPDPSLSLLAADLSEICERLTRIADRELGYEELREWILSFEFPKAPTVKNPKPDEALRAIDYRLSIKTAIGKLRDDFFSYSAEQWQSLYCDMSEYVFTLASFLSKFSSVYFEEKRRRGILEFSDIERLAYDALYASDGSLTPVALELRGHLTSVYIDEYQDVNELQNKIFEAVSPTDKRFMVGDIKQSIYGFRSARPEIFAEMKKSFPPLSEDEYTTEASIFMSNNYRCDEAIVDFVNEVFDGLFGAVKDSIGYVAEDKLIFKKRTPPDARREQASVILVEQQGRSEDEDTDSDYQPDTAPDVLEAEIVAERIERLLNEGTLADGSPIRPSDIAILVRTKKSFSLFENALAARGIASGAAEDADFFMNKEILLTLSLLNSIDNPAKDVHLASLMCSPLYGFSADELYLIKADGGGKTLYESLLKYCECNPEFTKGREFLSELHHYRALCEGMSIDTLLTRLYQETGLLSLASRQGGKENLYKLYSYARRFEGSAYKGLYNFIAYVNTLIEQGAKIDKSEGPSKTENAVTIGSIHSSKGLEFPVVFLANAGATLQNLDTRERIAFSEDFGISFLLRAPGGLALVENPLQRVIFDYMNKKFYEEIIRLLYVALTRAKERLFIVGRIKKSAEDFISEMQAQRKALSSYSVRKMKSYLEMICSATDDFCLDSLALDAKSSDASQTGKAEIEEPSVERDVDYDALSERLEERFSYVYPREHLTVLPEKISVSRLYPTVLDGADERDTVLFEDRPERSEPIPAFITQTPIDESAKRGIATHNFLQFFDLDELKKNGVRAELQRLTERGFLSEKTASLVRIDELELFAKSELFEAMQNAASLYREFRFNTRLPASLFTADEEKRRQYEDSTVLVQGVIDCLIESGDGTLRLIDYKTDRLTPREMNDESLAEAKLSAKHSLQLSYYALAVEKIFGVKPQKVEVFSVPLGKTFCLG